MDLETLKVGDRIRTVDGAIVEVVAETEDGRWIKVRYLEATDDPNLIGSEDLCSDDELVELVGV